MLFLSCFDVSPVSAVSIRETDGLMLYSIAARCMQLFLVLRLISFYSKGGMLQDFMIAGR